jgi:very-short-patch-repair endonuclease
VPEDADLPPEDADDLTWLLFRQDSVITRRQALQFLSAKAVRHRVNSGRWRRVHRGVFVTHTAALTHRQRQWAAVLATAAGGSAYLAGLSALQLFRLKRVDSRVIHVLLPDERNDVNPPPGVRVHRTRRLAAEDVHHVGLPPCTMPARSLVDAAQWASSPDQARLIIAATFQQRLVDGEDVASVLHRMPKPRRLPLIMATVADAEGGSHTLAELDFVALCRRAGLPTPGRQVRRTDADGRVRYLDAYFEQWGIHVEIDGRHHMAVDQWWQDMDRQNVLVSSGLHTLRFPSSVVRWHPEAVVLRLRAALTAAGWRG